MIIKVPTIILVFIIATFVSCKGEKEEDSEIAEKGKEIASEQVEREEVKIESVPPINHALAEKGEELFKTKGCIACHTIGKGKLTGPDLKGVTDRRDEEWLTKWLKDPETMVLTDPIAKELLKEFLVPMPNQGLSDEDVEALIAYLKHEDSNNSDEDDEDKDSFKKFMKEGK